MALRFSDRFLSRLGQTPSFGKQLTNIAGGLTAYPGMIAEQNKIKDMGMLELAQYNLKRARTPEQRAQALGVLEQAKAQTGKAAIDPILTAAMQTNNPALIKSLGQSAVNVAAKMGMPTAEIAKNFEGMMTGKRESNATTAADRLMATIKNTQDPRIQDSLQQTLEETLSRANLPTAEVAGYASRVRAQRQQDKLNAARADKFYEDQATAAENETWSEYSNRAANDIAQIVNTIDINNPDPEAVSKAQAIQQRAFNRGNAEGRDVKSFQSMFERGLNARLEDQRKRNKDAREEAQRQRQELTTAFAKQMFDASANIQNPVSWIDAKLMTKEFQGIKNPEEFKANVLEEFNLLVDRRTSQQKTQKEGELSPEDKAWLKDPKNQGYFDDYPEVLELDRLYSQTKDARLKRSYATQLNKAITIAQADQRKVARDDGVLKANIAEDVYRYKEEVQSYSNIFGSGFMAEDDIREGLDTILSDEELKSVFDAKMMQLYKANPNIDSNIAIENVVNEMLPETIVGQKKSDKVAKERVNERRLRSELKAKKIKQIAEQQGITTEEAEQIVNETERLITLSTGLM